jgi:hypothetical protein
VLVQAVIARHMGAITSSALGLFALAFASVTGASFTSSGNTAGRSTLKWPHYSPLIWPHPGRVAVAA